MKCDELQYERLGDANKTYPESTLVIRKQFVDGAIDELKREHHRERHEYIDMVAQLKAENQRLKKKMDDYHLMSDIRRAKIKGLKRALWLARAELCHRLDVDRYLRKHRNSWYNENCLTFNEACVAMEVKICKAESKCRAKADEYK